MHDAGVNDLTIQRVLRHSDVSVTRKSYIKRLPAQAVDAMNVFQAKIEKARKKPNDPFNKPRAVGTQLRHQQFLLCCVKNRHLCHGVKSYHLRLNQNVPQQT